MHVPKNAQERATVCGCRCMDAHEAELFRLFRPAADNSQGYELFITPLTTEDNKVLFDELYKKFTAGSHVFGSMSGNLSYISEALKKKLETLDKEKTRAIQHKQNFDPADLRFLLQNYRGEIQCFKSLHSTSSAVKLFDENSELGIVAKVGESIGYFLHPTVVQATLRFFVSLDNAAPIPLGSVNCWALPTDAGYTYYKSFVLDHVRSNHIDALLTYADRHWQEVINCEASDSADFLESMARFYWAQTIAAPYGRGSESIAKWMLTLTARYRNVEIDYRPDFASRMPFAMSPEEFVHYFKANAFLKHR